MAQAIRILVADDHAIVREGIRALLVEQPDMTLVGEAENGEQAIAQARAIQPDVILLDLLMPRKDGLSAIPEIRSNAPSARILVLTSFTEDKKIFPALKAGAHGYLLKDSSPQELVQAIRDVYAGESPLDPTVARKVIQALNSPESQSQETLTERELDVLKCMAEGLSNQEIAEKLVVGERTIRTHIDHILQKLKATSRTQAVMVALRRGWIEL